MFESHITVEMDKDEFINICQSLKVKSVVIEDDSGSSLPRQMMTARFHKTNSYETAFQEMVDLASHFPKVIRRKLERIGKQSVDCKYEEFHSKFKVTTERNQEFVDLVLRSGGHTARNVNKSSDYRFATSRSDLLHQSLLLTLKQKFDFFGTIHEFVVFDDNPEIDDRWVCQDCPLKVMR